MVVAVGTNISLSWAVAKTASPELASYYDLQITTPLGVVTYYEGSASWGIISPVPDVDTDGVLTRISPLTITEKGLYTIVIGTGGAASFTKITSSAFIAIEAATSKIGRINT